MMDQLLSNIKEYIKEHFATGDYDIHNRTHINQLIKKTEQYYSFYIKKHKLQIYFASYSNTNQIAFNFGEILSDMSGLDNISNNDLKLDIVTKYICSIHSMPKFE